MKKAKPIQPTLAPALGGSDKTPHKVWTGMLTFGLISMPVCLMTAAAEEKISFNQLHEKCKGRIKQQLHCPACEEVVPKTGLLKGFEFEKGQYLVITEKELTESEPAAAKVLELSAFVPANQLDPIFFESCYYLAPLEGGQKPYALVREAMLQSNLVGIARIVKNSREHICVVRPYGSGLIIHTLYWINEVRGMAYPALPETTESELTMARQLIQMLAADWDPSLYKDSYREAVMNLIATKRTGGEVVPHSPAITANSNVVDFADALKQSLEAMKARKGAA